MNPIENDFFDEFRYLEEICLQIYGRSPDGKLGVTQYMDDMKANEAIGSITVPDWKFQYKRLRECRNKRNNLSHPNSSYNVEPCSEDDIEFVISFKKSILNRTDPLALLEKHLNAKKPSASQSSYKYMDTYEEFEEHPRTNGYGFTAFILIACIGTILFLSFCIFAILLSLDGFQLFE